MDNQSAAGSSEHKANSSTHISSTAENVFSGRAGGGNSTALNCQNLSSNPFSLSTGNTGTGGILAKPKFSLKPASFAVTAAQAGDADNNKPTTDSQVSASNPFLRPAKLNYENSEDLDTTNVKVSSSSQDQAKQTDSSESSGDQSSAKADTNSTKAVSPQPRLSAAAALKTEAPSSSSSAGASSASFTAQRVNQTAFVFGEKLDDRVINAAKENGGANGHSADEAEDKPKIKTLEEAAEEYKKQQVCS